MTTAIAIRAAVRIQKWFRQQQASLEVRRKIYWRVDTSREYSDEEEFTGIQYHGLPLNIVFVDSSTYRIYWKGYHHGLPLQTYAYYYERLLINH